MYIQIQKQCYIMVKQLNRLILPGLADFMAPPPPPKKKEEVDPTC